MNFVKLKGSKMVIFKKKKMTRGSSTLKYL